MSITQKKRRINLSPEAQTFDFLKKIAKRDNMPIAKKTMQLIKRSLELEEDLYWGEIAEKRLENPKTISEDKFWNKVFLS